MKTENFPKLCHPWYQTLGTMVKNKLAFAERKFGLARSRLQSYFQFKAKHAFLNISNFNLEEFLLQKLGGDTERSGKGGLTS